MKGKHNEPSNFELMKELEQLKQEIRKLGIKKKPESSKIITLLLLIIMFGAFSFVIAYYYTITNELINLLQFINSLIVFSIGLVIGDLRN